jgi:hypothetical protein
METKGPEFLITSKDRRSTIHSGKPLTSLLEKEREDGEPPVRHLEKYKLYSRGW